MLMHPPNERARFIAPRFQRLGVRAPQEEFLRRVRWKIDQFALKGCTSHDCKKVGEHHWAREPPKHTAQRLPVARNHGKISLRENCHRSLPWQRKAGGKGADFRADFCVRSQGTASSPSAALHAHKAAGFSRRRLAGVIGSASSFGLLVARLVRVSYASHTRLVPKFHLGTRVSPKLCFAPPFSVHPCGAWVCCPTGAPQGWTPNRAPRRRSETSPTRHSQVELGNEGRTTGRTFNHTR